MADLKQRQLDRRVVDRYVAKGHISADDYKKHIDSLPDLEGEAQWVEMDLHDTELGDDLGSDDN